MGRSLLSDLTEGSTMFRISLLALTTITCLLLVQAKSEQEHQLSESISNNVLTLSRDVRSPDASSKKNGKKISKKGKRKSKKGKIIKDLRKILKKEEERTGKIKQRNQRRQKRTNPGKKEGKIIKRR